MKRIKEKIKEIKDKIKTKIKGKKGTTASSANGNTAIMPSLSSPIPYSTTNQTISHIAHRISTTQDSASLSNETEPSFPLTDDILYDNVLSCLDTQTLGRFSQVSKGYNSLFEKPLVNRHLLHHVLNGEQKEANKLLLKLKALNPSNYCLLVLKKGRGREVHCDRNWHNVSPLEFAAWSGDKFMLEMLLEHIPIEYRYLALEQLKHVKENGTEHGKHLSAVKVLLEAFKEHTANYEVWDWQQRDEHWI